MSEVNFEVKRISSEQAERLIKNRQFKEISVKSRRLVTDFNGDYSAITTSVYSEAAIPLASATPSAKGLLLLKSASHPTAPTFLAVYRCGRNCNQAAEQAKRESQQFIRKAGTGLEVGTGFCNRYLKHPSPYAFGTSIYDCLINSVHYGDANGDGLTDILVVLQNPLGKGGAFLYQQIPIWRATH